MTISHFVMHLLSDNYIFHNNLRTSIVLSNSFYENLSKEFYTQLHMKMHMF